MASELLQEDLEKHHVYFNNMGFHSKCHVPDCAEQWESQGFDDLIGFTDHIVHHILSIFVLGAAPEEIRDAYNRNKGYQRRALPTDETVVQTLYNQEEFKKYLGRERNYPNYLEFFQREIEKKGVENVLNQYLFSGEENAESMLARLFGGEYCKE